MQIPATPIDRSAEADLVPALYLWAMLLPTGARATATPVVWLERILLSVE